MFLISRSKLINIQSIKTLHILLLPSYQDFQSSFIQCVSLIEPAMALLRILVFVENVMGIYRNYLYFNKYLKVLIIIRVIFEIVVSLGIAWHNVRISVYKSIETGEDVLVLLLFQAIILMKVFVLGIGPLRKAMDYKLYLENLKIINNRCQDIPSYAKSLNVMKLKCFVVAILIVSSSVVLSISRVNDLNTKNPLIFVNAMVEECYEAWVDYRYIIDHLVAYTGITGIRDCLKILNESVHDVIEQCSKEQEEHFEEEDRTKTDLVKQVNGWMEFYGYIMSCKKHLSRCFSELVIKFIKLNKI